jgi:hypothetical protein
MVHLSQDVHFTEHNFHLRIVDVLLLNIFNRYLLTRFPILGLHYHSKGALSQLLTNLVPRQVTATVLSDEGRLVKEVVFSRGF